MHTAVSRIRVRVTRRVPGGTRGGTYFIANFAWPRNYGHNHQSATMASDSTVDAVFTRNVHVWLTKGFKNIDKDNSGGLSEKELEEAALKQVIEPRVIGTGMGDILLLLSSRHQSSPPPVLRTSLISPSWDRLGIALHSAPRRATNNNQLPPASPPPSPTLAGLDGHRRSRKKRPRPLWRKWTTTTTR